jgi:hypothetical protein
MFRTAGCVAGTMLVSQVSRARTNHLHRLPTFADGARSGAVVYAVVPVGA